MDNASSLVLSLARTGEQHLTEQPLGMQRTGSRPLRPLCPPPALGLTRSSWTRRRAARIRKGHATCPGGFFDALGRLHSDVSKPYNPNIWSNFKKDFDTLAQKGFFE